MRIRYVIQVVTRAPCSEPTCYGEKSHELAAYSYTLPNGTAVELQPGDVYFSEDHTGKRTCDWDNCDGKHLICMVPDKDWPEGHPWQIDGRAGNCTMKDERTHRCWVRHGSPEDGTLHVDKAGHTCKAGAGSIQTNNWHGFLHQGCLEP